MMNALLEIHRKTLRGQKRFLIMALMLCYAIYNIMLCYANAIFSYVMRKVISRS